MRPSASGLTRADRGEALRRAGRRRASAPSARATAAARAGPRARTGRGRCDRRDGPRSRARRCGTRGPVKHGWTTSPSSPGSTLFAALTVAPHARAARRALVDERADVELAGDVREERAVRRVDAHADAEERRGSLRHISASASRSTTSSRRIGDVADDVERAAVRLARSRRPSGGVPPRRARLRRTRSRAPPPGRRGRGSRPPWRGKPSGFEAELVA